MKYKIFCMEQADLSNGSFTTKHKAAGKVTMIETETVDKEKTLLIGYFREVDEKDVKKILVKAEDYEEHDLTKLWFDYRR